MNDQNRRLFLTILMCMAVAYIWAMFVEPKLNPAPPPDMIQSGTNKDQAVQEVVSPGAHGATTPQQGTPGGLDKKVEAAVPRGTENTLPRPPTRTVVLTSDKLRVELVSDGAAIRSAQLLGDKYLHASVRGEPKKAVELVDSHAAPLPFSLEITDGAPGLRDPTAALPELAADAGYELLSSDEHSAVFRARTAKGLEVTKTISLDPHAYKVDVAVDVRSAQPLSGRVSVLATGWGDPSLGTGGFFSNYFTARVAPSQVSCRGSKDLSQLTANKPNKVADASGTSFVGINEQYFLLALVPAPGSQGTACHLESRQDGGLVGALELPLSLVAGATAHFAVNGFAGPKLTEALDQVSPALREAIDWGFLGVIVKLLLAGMRFFHQFVPPHNWGLAVILLTVSLKLITFPLTQKQMKSMQEMQRIQPQLEELKKKYPGDTQKQQMEQAKLFQEHGVNPMASCLPMLVQFPVWIALYNTLRVSAELYNAPFILGWIDDLTAKDPFFIIPALMGVSMIVTQLLTPQPTSNPSQRTMTLAMSAFFTLALFVQPAGLTLYILVNNALSIAQQVYLRRQFKLLPAAGQTVAVASKRA